MALSPVLVAQEQLPLDRFLAEGAAEQCSIFGLDGAVFLSTHELCTCETIGPELEVCHDNEGEDEASKAGILVMDTNSMEILGRQS